jgi:negative regulator of flagellin synthesis FlgM
MRVDAYNQINQVYPMNTKKMAVSKVPSKDTVSISASGRDYQVARSAVLSAPDIRGDRVAELKAKIQAGNYQVSPDSFAEKLIAKYEENMGAV